MFFQILFLVPCCTIWSADPFFMTPSLCGCQHCLRWCIVPLCCGFSSKFCLSSCFKADWCYQMARKWVMSCAVIFKCFIWLLSVSLLSVWCDLLTSKFLIGFYCFSGPASPIWQERTDSKLLCSVLGCCVWMARVWSDNLYSAGPCWNRPCTKWQESSHKHESDAEMLCR